MFKRLTLLAVTAAIALVPVTAAHAGVPRDPQIEAAKLCVPKWVKPPRTMTLQEQYDASMTPVDSFDVENGYASNGSGDDGTVEHDDLTYDGC